MGATSQQARPVRYRTDADGVLHRVVVFDGVEGFHEHFTYPCTGCADITETTSVSDRGPGCRECGHTGVQHGRHWLPFGVVESWTIAAKTREAGKGALLLRGSVVLEISNRPKNMRRAGELAKALNRHGVVIEAKGARS
jgi:hypothetical protein